MLGRRAHVFHNPAAHALIVSRPEHSARRVAADRLAIPRSTECLGEPGHAIAPHWRGNDRQRIEKHDRRRQRRVGGSKLERDGATHAVAHDDRAFDLELFAEPGDVVAKRVDRVFAVRWSLAATESREIGCDHPMPTRKVLDLGCEVLVVAQAMDEDDRGTPDPMSSKNTHAPCRCAMVI